MSTLAIPSLAPLEKQRKSQVRLTPRGRLVARSAVVASLSIVLAASASFITGATAGSKESAVSTPYALITVKPGETLWSIASVLAAHGDPATSSLRFQRSTISRARSSKPVRGFTSRHANEKPTEDVKTLNQCFTLTPRYWGYFAVGFHK